MKTAYYILMTAALAASIWKRKSLPSQVGTFIPLIGLAIGMQVFVQYIVTAPRDWIWVFHFYQLLALPLLAWYFLKTIRLTSSQTFLKALIPLFYLLTAAYYYYHPQAWHELFIPEQAFLGLFTVIGTLFIFHQLYLDETELYLTRSPHFWLGLGNLIFYTGYIFSLGSYQYIDQVLGDQELAKTFLSITHYLNLFLYSMYTIAFLCPRKTNPSSSL